MKKKNKGFTLVELCVVMALMAIVATMAVGFMMSFQKSAGSVKVDTSAIRDITNVNNFIEKWVRAYDSTAYIVTCESSNTLVAQYADTSNANYGKENSLKTKDGKLVWTQDGTEYSSITPELVTALEFSFAELKNASGQPLTVDSQAVANSSVITCVVRYNKSRWETLNFAVFSATVRSRYSPKDRY